MTKFPADSQKTILFVITTLRLGGTERQLVMLAEALLLEGWRVHVYCIECSGPLVTTLADTGVELHDGGFSFSLDSKSAKAFGLAKAQLRLFRLIRCVKPNIVHAFLPLPNLMGVLAGRLAFVPLVITARRGMGTHQDRHPGWKIFDRLANRLSKVVIANSEAVRRDTIQRDGIAPDKIITIRNGLDFPSAEMTDSDRHDLRQSLGLRDHQLGILSVGNLIAYKGYDDLIEAIARLAPGEPALKFFIAGADGGQGANLERRVQALGLADQITFLGQRADISALMAVMDIFVLPSHEEGFSNALLEAMAAGRPIIATSVGGNPEALGGGRYGTLMPPRDPEALAMAISQLTGSLDEAQGIARDAARHVTGVYSKEVMVRSYLELYNRLGGN